MIESEDGTYYIKQKFIDGDLLRDVDVYNLSPVTQKQLIDLLQSYISYGIEENVFLDVFGFQNYQPRNKLTHQLYWLLNVRKSYLWSSNIIVDKQGDVFMVDVCETGRSRLHLYSRIKRKINQLFMENNIKKLEQRIVQKEVSGKMPCKTD